MKLLKLELEDANGLQETHVNIDQVVLVTKDSGGNCFVFTADDPENGHRITKPCYVAICKFYSKRVV